MKQPMNNVRCPQCGHIYKGHTNHFGKVCIHCDACIPPFGELPIVRENKHKLLLAQHKLREHLHEGANHANRNRRNST